MKDHVHVSETVIPDYLVRTYGKDRVVLLLGDEWAVVRSRIYEGRYIVDHRHPLLTDRFFLNSDGTETFRAVYLISYYATVEEAEMAVLKYLLLRAAS